MEHITEGMAGEQESLIISEEQAGQRADVGLAALLDITRSNMQKLLDDGRAVKGSKVLKANYKLRAGDEIVVTLPEPQPLNAQPENIPLDIIYEDEDVIVINKARGMVVHPAAGNYSGTLVNALLHHCKNLFHIHPAADCTVRCVLDDRSVRHRIGKRHAKLNHVAAAALLRPDDFFCGCQIRQSRGNISNKCFLLLFPAGIHARFYSIHICHILPHRTTFRLNLNILFLQDNLRSY